MLSTFQKNFVEKGNGCMKRNDRSMKCLGWLWGCLVLVMMMNTQVSSQQKKQGGSIKNDNTHESQPPVLTGKGADPADDVIIDAPDDSSGDSTSVDQQMYGDDNSLD